MKGKLPAERWWPSAADVLIFVLANGYQNKKSRRENPAGFFPTWS
jgi:hypothetical protein